MTPSIFIAKLLTVVMLVLPETAFAQCCCVSLDNDSSSEVRAPEESCCCCRPAENVPTCCSGDNVDCAGCGEPCDGENCCGWMVPETSVAVLLEAEQLPNANVSSACLVILPPVCPGDFRRSAVEPRQRPPSHRQRQSLLAVWLK